MTLRFKYQHRGRLKEFRVGQRWHLHFDSKMEMMHFLDNYLLLRKFNELDYLPGQKVKLPYKVVDVVPELNAVVVETTIDPMEDMR